MKEEDSSEKNLERITVYTSPELKQEMEEYQKLKGYKSLSDMLRRGYFILKQVFGTESIELREISIKEQLDRIEQRLDEIQLEKQVIEKKEEILQTEVEEITTEEIPSFEQVSKDILDLIREFDGIKDFVLMEHLRYKYSEGIIWMTLNKLRDKKEIQIKEGIWKINGQ